jgi:hypothetical protein
MEKISCSGASLPLHLTKCYPGHPVKENKMGGEFGMHGGEEKCMTLLWGNLREDHLEDQDVDGRILLKCFLKK